MRDVVLEDEGTLCTLRLRNDDRRNAISADMWVRIGEIAEQLAAREDLRVLVVRGWGGEYFSAGADISEFDSVRDAGGTDSYDALVEESCRRIEQLPFPTVAAIHGYCIGAGLSLAASCDLRYCDREARFAVPAARLGLGYDYHGIERFVALVGVAATREILYRASRIDAARALAIGLVHAVLPARELDTHVEAVVAELLANAPLTLRAVKACTREMLRPAAERDTARCEELVRRCNESDDYREGRAAFREKRQPLFRGR